MTNSLEGFGLYEYGLLPSQRHIRLLELHPGKQNDTIDCSLHFADIDSVLHYEAISYAWGGDSNRIRVSCDGKDVMITSNLGDALQQFRLKDESRIIWADAICIDQTNLSERGMQVRLMKDIYDKASRVCVWLGLANAHTPLAVEFIQELVRQLDCENTIAPSHHDIKRYVTTFRDSLPNPTSERWQSLGKFFSTPWFTRMWVIQEVSGHACMVFNGEFEIKWSHVISTARALLELYILQFFQDIAHVPLGNCIHALQIDYAAYWDDSTQGQFDMFRSFHCSDERDKVYALMSFPPLNGIHPPILPDYKKTVAEVFEEATVSCFTAFQSLSLLSSIDHNICIEEGWPSWVPRWDRGRSIQILHHYASGREHSSTAQIKCRSGMLIAQGIRISIVSKCTEVITESMLSLKPIEGELNPLSALFIDWEAQILPKLTQTVDVPYLDYLAMTLTAGLDAESNCPPSNISQYRLDFLAYFRAAMTILGSALCATDIQDALLQKAATGDEQSFCRAAERGSRNKRVFWTMKGEFGIGPKATQEGDIIVLLYGANAPCILRQKEMHHQFVGECYLHNYMHGEPIEMVIEGLLVAEDFVLE